MLTGEIQISRAIKTLSDLGYRPELPLSVYGEIKQQFREVMKLIEDGDITVLDEVYAEIFLKLKNRYPQLGNGELDVLAHGLHNEKNDDGEYYCIIDDGLSRKVAKEVGIKFTGTVGLLNFMCKKNCFSKDEIDDINKKLDFCRVPKKYRLPF